jgi:hypothetical protein
LQIKPTVDRPKKAQEKPDNIRINYGSTGRTYILLRADPNDLALKGLTKERFANLAVQVQNKIISAAQPRARPASAKNDPAAVSNADTNGDQAVR